MPADSGLAFVLVPHLDPTHKGMMQELLARCMSMKLVQVEDGTPVRPDQIHIIFPNKDMTISNGVLQLHEPSSPRGARAPIDLFLRHLAEDQEDRSIAVIMSGMGTDGTLGVKTVQELWAWGSSKILDRRNTTACRRAPLEPTWWTALLQHRTSRRN